MDKSMINRYLSNWKTIPNFISFVRILLIPVFGVLFREGHLVWALIIVVISGLTDFVDGKIARKFNQISDLGKLLDPLADKLTQITLAILLFLEFNECSDATMKTFSWVFLIFLVKEAIFVVGAIIMLSLGMIPSAAEIYGPLNYPPGPKPQSRPRASVCQSEKWPHPPAHQPQLAAAGQGCAGSP